MSTEIIDITTKNQLETIVKANEKVILDFHAAWCGPCKALHMHYTKAAEKSDAVFLRADADVATELVDAFSVQSIPTVLAFKDGKLVGPITSRTAISLVDEIKAL